MSLSAASRRLALGALLALAAGAASAQVVAASAPAAPASAPRPQPAPTSAGASLLSQMSSGASDLVVNALDQIGVRYRWGGNGNGSFDCSGLVQHVYQQTLGLVLPHNARAQSHEGVKVAADQLQPGDLVFFRTVRRTISHVGIYIGNGEFVHAPHTGARVQVQSLDDAYWGKRFVTARRLLDPSEVDLVTSAAASQPQVARALAQAQLAASAARAAANPAALREPTDSASQPAAGSHRKPAHHSRVKHKKKKAVRHPHRKPAHKASAAHHAPRKAGASKAAAAHHPHPA